MVLGPRLATDPSPAVLAAERLRSSGNASSKPTVRNTKPLPQGNAALDVARRLRKKDSAANGGAGGHTNTPPEWRGAIEKLVGMGFARNASTFLHFKFLSVILVYFMDQTMRQLLAHGLAVVVFSF